MKVTHTRSSSGPAQRRPVGRSPISGGTASFAGHVETAAPKPSGIGAASPLVELGGVLAVQEVSQAPAQRNGALRHGHALLAQLDDLRGELLASRGSKATVRRLARLLDAPRPASGDPKLDRLLDEVEVRAAVEVARRQSD